LSAAEAADYLLHQIRAAGGRPETIITDEAVELIARASRGVPRLINQSAHLALRLASAADAVVVDAEAAMEALAQLGLGEEPAAVGPETKVIALGGVGEEPEMTEESDAEEGCRLYPASRRLA
jgi:hypothetical protein